MTTSSRIQAWRKAAGFKSAADAVAAFAKRYKCKPGKDGCPTVATWRAMEQTNGSICSLGRLDQVARLLGVGCCLRLRTAWPENFHPKEEPLSLRERVGKHIPSKPCGHRAPGRSYQAPPSRRLQPQGIVSGTRMRNRRTGKSKSSFIRPLPETAGT